ncbi:hypothetical protein [Lacinutrix sp.]|uniref:hypothetical protein n=1 Tax=Lacinutrix sp. TaxID=1937692 RepID=UPI0025C0879A|nr:hypothetical protein [Lacinutrix sp.]
MKLFKTKLKLIIGLMLVLGSLFTSCNPDDSDNGLSDSNTNPESQIDLGTSIQRDFMGRIVDQSNLPVDNAVVTIGSQIVTTDTNGIFIVNSANVKERQAFIVVEKTGYFKGMRSVVPTEGTNNIKITLITQNLVSTITSGSSNDVTLPNGTKVTFDGNFKDDNGNAYSGNVDVYLYHLETSNPDINTTMPGSLQAVNETGNERVLESYGMLNVELRGAAGQELNIADGSVAKIELPVDLAQMSIAPTTIPLWHFDEVNGYWVEEGQATLVGNKYIGEVSHFSWWNCDAPFPTVDLCLNVVDASSNPVSNALVELWRSGATYPNIGISNGNGEICGLIPANETLTLKAFDQCGVEVFSTTIGPFSTDTNLGNVVMPAVTATIITGNLIDCSNTNIVNGYVAINYGNDYSTVDVVNGSFSLSVIQCASLPTFTLEGLDFDTFQSTTVLPFNFSNANVGNIIACSTVTEFVSIQIDNDPVDYFLTNFNAGSNGSTTSFGISTQTTTASLIILGGSTTPGTYMSTGVSNFLFEFGIDQDFNVPDTLQYTLNNFGVIGGYIDMNIAGDYTDNSGVVRTLSASVHVIRDH